MEPRSCLLFGLSIRLTLFFGAWIIFLIRPVSGVVVLQGNKNADFNRCILICARYIQWNQKTAVFRQPCFSTIVEFELSQRSTTATQANSRSESTYEYK